MRAIVYMGGDGPEVRDDVEFRRPLGDGQVRVRIASAGLCHSDVSLLNGTIPFPTPVVMGHEGAGEVIEVGGGVSHVAVGDHVVTTTLGSCGVCKRCADGQPVLCKSSNQISRPFTVGDDKAFSFANSATWADEAVVQAVQAVKIPTDVPFDVACLIGCGVLTGVGAVWNRARVQRGDTVAVIGAGGIGLSVIQGARLAGARRIVAVDTNPAKEDLARRFGATDFVAPATDEEAPTLADQIKAVDGLGDGVDHAFECVGAPPLIRAAIDSLDWGGNAVLVGVPKFGSEASFVVASMYHDKSILGCRYGSSAPQRDIGRIVDAYQRGDLLLDELVSATYPFADIDAALADLAAGKVARAVLNPS